MENKQQNELGTKNISKLLFSMAIPAITAQIINLLYNMVDRKNVGEEMNRVPNKYAGCCGLLWTSLRSIECVLHVFFNDTATTEIYTE